MSSAHDNTVTGGKVKFFNLLLNPSSETVRKIGLVKKMLKDGKPLYSAIREAKLGWKNYYKYAPLIYDDPEIPIPLPKTLIREYRYRGIDVDGLRIMLDYVAKHEATKLIRDILAGRRGEEIWQKLKRNPGRYWLQLCRDLQRMWIDELCLPIL
jgi:hypothetical protein